jgi:hypothetical protein
MINGVLGKGTLVLKQLNKVHLLWSGNSPERELFLIRLVAVFGKKHVNNFILFVDFIKKAVSADAISPCWWLPISKSFDIWTKFW